jgi:hypothetical protein
METKSIVDSAAEVVERYLTLVETEVSSKSVQRSGRFVCDCPTCHNRRRETLAWLDAILAELPREQTA